VQEVEPLRAEVENLKAERKVQREKYARLKEKYTPMQADHEKVKGQINETRLQLQETQIKSKIEIDRLSNVGKGLEMHIDKLVRHNAWMEQRCRELEAESRSGGSATLAAQHDRAAAQGRDLCEQHAQLPPPQAVPVPLPQLWPQATAGGGLPPQPSRDPRLRQPLATPVATAAREDRDPLLALVRESEAPPPRDAAAAPAAQSDALTRKAAFAKDFKRFIGHPPSPAKALQKPRLQLHSGATVSAAHVDAARAAKPATPAQPSSERRPGGSEQSAPKLARLVSAQSVSLPKPSERFSEGASAQVAKKGKPEAESTLRSATSDADSGMGDFIPLDDSPPPGQAADLPDAAAPPKASGEWSPLLLRSVQHCSNFSYFIQ
jgi:hypothetical protein